MRKLHCPNFGPVVASVCVCVSTCLHSVSFGESRASIIVTSGTGHRLRRVSMKDAAYNIVPSATKGLERSGSVFRNMPESALPRETQHPGQSRAVL